MKVKSTVRFGEINKYTAKFFEACLECESELQIKLVLTSANDSVHGENSLHPEDKAWDLRANDKSGPQRVAVVLYLRNRLGHGWDIILETPADPAKHHFHIERDTRTYPEPV